MEVEVLSIDPTGKLQKKGILGFAEVKLTDESGDAIVLRGIKIIRSALGKRVKILYPRRKRGFLYFSIQGKLMRKVNDAILKKYSEICEIEELMEMFA